MNTTSVSSDTSSESPEVGSIDMKLEVVTLPVSDVDRASPRTSLGRFSAWCWSSPTSTQRVVT